VTIGVCTKILEAELFLGAALPEGAGADEEAAGDDAGAELLGVEDEPAAVEELAGLDDVLDGLALLLLLVDSLEDSLEDALDELEAA
jgi:hypothetical protein